MDGGVGALETTGRPRLHVDGKLWFTTIIVRCPLLSFLLVLAPAIALAVLGL
eukprot:COSAG06_NODE_35942_length_453_cov_1.867232_1_plen_51_part_10